VIILLSLLVKDILADAEVKKELHAESELVEEPPATNAVLFNPIMPTLTVLASGLLSLTEIDDYFNVRALDFNLRGYHMFDNRWGLISQLDISSATFLVNATHAGIRIGPRISLRNQGLSDWMVAPFILGGITRISAGGYGLSHWGVLGGGGEIGRTWVWNHIAFDIGLGLYSTTNVGYRSQAEAFAGTAAPESFFIKPTFNFGIGYAF
jgi:hypothetical protein